jgi:hypothetical protein
MKENIIITNYYPFILLLCGRFASPIFGCFAVPILSCVDPQMIWVSDLMNTIMQKYFTIFLFFAELLVPSCVDPHE